MLLVIPGPAPCWPKELKVFGGPRLTSRRARLTQEQSLRQVLFEESLKDVLALRGRRE
jgi:hypothetical protein